MIAVLWENAPSLEKLSETARQKLAFLVLQLAAACEPAPRTLPSKQAPPALRPTPSEQVADVLRRARSRPCTAAVRRPRDGAGLLDVLWLPGSCGDDACDSAPEGCCECDGFALDEEAEVAL